ncbi:hypothetical protein PM082_020103 [Marasmius tenuissimus]|nr:hypothetical protein PM082_020103 [Marasmius tenuissimus]
MSDRDPNPNNFTQEELERLRRRAPQASYWLRITNTHPFIHSPGANQLAQQGSQSASTSDASASTPSQTSSQSAAQSPSPSQSSDTVPFPPSTQPRPSRPQPCTPTPPSTQLHTVPPPQYASQGTPGLCPPPFQSQPNQYAPMPTYPPLYNHPGPPPLHPFQHTRNTPLPYYSQLLASPLNAFPYGHYNPQVPVAPTPLGPLPAHPQPPPVIDNTLITVSFLQPNSTRTQMQVPASISFTDFLACLCHPMRLNVPPDEARLGYKHSGDRVRDPVNELPNEQAWQVAVERTLVGMRRARTHQVVLEIHNLAEVLPTQWQHGTD